MSTETGKIPDVRELINYMDQKPVRQIKFFKN